LGELKRMKISVRQTLLLPTAQYANMSIEVGMEVDTSVEGDLAALGLSGDAPAAEIASQVRNFVETELFESKEAVEQRPKGDFKLAIS